MDRTAYYEPSISTICGINPGKVEISQIHDPDNYRKLLWGRELRKMWEDLWLQTALFGSGKVFIEDTTYEPTEFSGFAVKNIIMEEKKMAKMTKEQLKKELRKLDGKMEILKSNMSCMTKEMSDLDKARSTIVKCLDQEQWEITDAEAPRCGHTWSSFEKENLMESFHKFLHGQAKKYGRSTLSIRYKFAEEIAQNIEYSKWMEVWVRENNR